MVDGVLVYFEYPQAHEDDAERENPALQAVLMAFEFPENPQSVDGDLEPPEDTTLVSASA
jgi:hypothetical protein